MKNSNVLVLTFSIAILSLYSCKESKTNTSTPVKEQVSTTATLSIKQLKTKVGKNTYTEAKQRTLNWFKKLEFDPDRLTQENYNVQKHLAEYLGLAKLLYTSASLEEKKEIKNYISKAYQFTLKPVYHNLDALDAKAFKTNSMSYLRILFLLNSFEFNTDFYSKEVAKIKTKLDNHLSQRGDWQRWAFDNYYTALNLEKPALLNGINSRKGIVNSQIPAEQYNLNQAYELTHLVFAAYNYGASKTQNKFSPSDISYINKTLDVLSKKYRLKNNRDILSELVTSMELLNSHTSEFKTATNYLLSKQNYDGTWGNYEKARHKYGDLINIRLYLHTTLVVFESLVSQFEKQD